MSLSRELTKTEKMLMALLAAIILGIAYFFLVFTPINNRTAEIETALVAADDELLTLQTMQTKMISMEAVVTKAKAEPKTIEAPDYDNIKNVMAMLNNVMGATEGYNISFEALKDTDLADGIIRRKGRITYLAANYNQAKEVFSQLYAGPYRCLISDMSIRANATATGEQDTATLDKSKVQVDMVISYYEVKSTKTVATTP